MLQSFITRPILSSVIAILIALVGVLSMFTLPISQYPDVVPPSIQVSAFYPGANAEDVQKTVAVPLEEQINGVDNMTYMTSQCANDGSCNITVYFEVGTDPDMATVNVQNRAQRAMNLLPAEVTQSGVTVLKKSPSILMLYALVSHDTAYDVKFLSNYLNINVVNVLKRIPGVGDVNLFGGDDYAMRIWLNPERMAGLGITVQDVQSAIRDQNVQAAAGMLGKPPAAKGQEMSIMLRVQGRLASVEEFGRIIVKASKDGSLIRMSDIARIELGLRSYDAYGRFNGKPAPVIAVYQSPGSNAVQVQKDLDKIMEELAREFPTGITYQKGLDTVEFVNASIEEVLHTLLEAFILVFIVVFIFLQDWRATLIPAITVPVSLVGALAAFSFMGFSINMLTLFALVLAIGIVVDDAIVVLEAVQEKIDNEKLSPLEATKHTMHEITPAIITITMVLCAVFIPVSFLGGTTGVMYKQFALTLISSILISAVLALTLTPPLCVMLLKPKQDKKGLLGRFFKAFDKGFDRTTHGYMAVVTNFTHKLSRPMLFLALICVLMVFVMKFLPSGFLPSEDQGYFFVNINTPKAYSLEKTDAVAEQVEGMLSKLEGVESYTMIPGYSILDNTVSTTNAMCFVKLKPWSERSSGGLHAEMIIRRLQAQMNYIPGGICMAFNAPAISGLGKTGGLELQLEDKAGAGREKFGEVIAGFYQATQGRKEFSSVFSSFRNDIPQFKLTVDKEKARMMDVPVNSIYQSLQTLFGSSYVNDFNQFGKSYRVIVQADAIYRANKEDIAKVHVRSNSGKMIPLGTLMDAELIQGPEVVKRFNLFSSADFTIGIPPGSSTGEAIAAVKEISASVLPYGFGYEYSGMTREEIISGGQAPFIFALCFIFVYFLLAAKYESWLLPIPVLLAIPFGVFGALGLQWLRGLQNNIYAQIGLIMLIGLVAKNAILIVEFAKQKHDAGHPLAEAALEGARLRFRPILMTSFAFILGVVPLMTAAGAGAASRHALGTSVFGGMLFATICGVLVTPALYVAFQKLENRMKGKGPKMPNALLVAGLMVVASSFLSGCRVGPDYKRPAVPGGTTFRYSTSTDSLSLADLEWITLFRDTVLQNLVKRTLDNNPDLLIAAARVEEARAGYRIRRGELWPQVGISGSGGWTRSALPNGGGHSEYSFLEAAGTMSWEIDLWGKLRRSREAARANLLSQEAYRQSVRLTMINEVVQSYIRLLEYDNEMMITGENIRIREKSLELVRAKLIAGNASGLVVAQAEAELALARSEIPRLEMETGIEENFLCTLLGEEPHDIPRGKAITEQLNLPSLITPGIPSGLITRRPDIIMAEQSLVAANANIGAARAMMLPSLNLSGNIGSAFMPAEMIYNAVGNLVAPVFQGGKLRANLKLTIAQKEQMLEGYRKTILNALQEVSGALLKVEKMDDVVSSDEITYQAAKTAYELSEQLYRAGYASFLDVINAQSMLFESQINLSRSRTNEILALAGLYKALGGGWR